LRQPSRQTIRVALLTTVFDNMAGYAETAVLFLHRASILLPNHCTKLP
jgi:hypothetical protein